MMTAELEQGSFRDPAGSVFQNDGLIYRTVNPVAKAAYEYCRDCIGFSSLIDRGWVISSSEIPKSGWEALGVNQLFSQQPSYVLQHPKLPFVSYPYEWTFGQLRAAALRHLEIQLEGLEHGIVLSDASGFNMQFIGGQAIHVDTLSFRPYQEREIWVGYDQFCRHFLYPLLVEKYTGVAFNKLLFASIDGLHINDVYRLIPCRHRYASLRYILHIVLRYKSDQKVHRLDDLKAIAQTKLPLSRFKSMLQDMHDWISGLVSPSSKSYWQDYARKNSYKPTEQVRKEAFVESFVRRQKPLSLIDLGGNSGDYARAAQRAGVKYSVVVDADLGALEVCFQKTSEANDSIGVLYTSLTDPSPERGWNQQERMGFNQRAKADGVLALALVHHLAINGGVPFVKVLNWILDRANCGVIEFVPKTDLMVQRMLSSREDRFDDYSMDVMREVINKRGVILEEFKFESSGRVLIEYQLNSQP